MTGIIGVVPNAGGVPACSDRSRNLRCSTRNAEHRSSAEWSIDDEFELDDWALPRDIVFERSRAIVRKVDERRHQLLFDALDGPVGWVAGGVRRSRVSTLFRGVLARASLRDRSGASDMAGCSECSGERLVDDSSSRGATCGSGRARSACGDTSGGSGSGPCPWRGRRR